jgi:hypothetical protein
VVWEASYLRLPGRGLLGHTLWLTPLLHVCEFTPTLPGLSALFEAGEIQDIEDWQAPKQL